MATSSWPFGIEKNCLWTQQARHIWNITSQIVARLFDQYSNPIGSEQVLDEIVWFDWATQETAADGTLFWNGDQAYEITAADMIPNVEWTGDRYRVIWSHGNRLMNATVAKNGVYLSNASTVASDVASDAFNRTNPPQLAYEPNNRFILVPYRDASNVLTGLLFHRDTTTPIATRRPLVQPENSAWAYRPSIAFYPAINGFMLTYRNTYDGLMHYNVLSHDALPRGGGSTGIAWSNLQNGARPLSCPPITASPLAVFPFEEVPGATEFEELYTGYSYGDCSGDSCPQAGAEGAGTNGNTFNSNGSPPQTDSALLFDGINDKVTLPRYVGDGDFSISFWLKTDQVAPSDGWYDGARGLVDADVANRG